MKKIFTGKPQNKNLKKPLQALPARPEQAQIENGRYPIPPDEETVKRLNEIGMEYTFSAYYKPRKYDPL